MNDIDNIISQIKNNSNDENKKLARELQKKLSQSQTDALNKLISNKELMQKIMSSDEVKEIKNKIGGENNGHK